MGKINTEFRCYRRRGCNWGKASFGKKTSTVSIAFSSSAVAIIPLYNLLFIIPLPALIVSSFFNVIRNPITPDHHFDISLGTTLHSCLIQSLSRDTQALQPSLPTSRSEFIACTQVACLGSQLRGARKRPWRWTLLSSVGSLMVLFSEITKQIEEIECLSCH